MQVKLGQYWIKKASDRHPLVAPIPETPDNDGYTPQRAHQVIQRLEHIARWQNILDLKTSPTSQANLVRSILWWKLERVTRSLLVSISMPNPVGNSKLRLMTLVN
ncbi:hypothetical protein [Scytonema sp. NUACC26]|uniref:hypothetical protein n=1 Tax=Scytonema sp. NUACC26 TaxID=3140176 RepID=UPI0038B3463A